MSNEDILNALFSKSKEGVKELSKLSKNQVKDKILGAGKIKDILTKAIDNPYTMGAVSWGLANLSDKVMNRLPVVKYASPKYNQKQAMNNIAMPSLALKYYQKFPSQAQYLPKNIQKQYRIGYYRPPEQPMVNNIVSTDNRNVQPKVTSKPVNQQNNNKPTGFKTGRVPSPNELPTLPGMYNPNVPNTTNPYADGGHLDNTGRMINKLTGSDAPQLQPLSFNTNNQTVPSNLQRVNIGNNQPEQQAPAIRNESGNYTMPQQNYNQQSGYAVNPQDLIKSMQSYVDQQYQPQRQQIGMQYSPEQLQQIQNILSQKAQQANYLPDQDKVMKIMNILGTEYKNKLNNQAYFMDAQGNPIINKLPEAPSILDAVDKVNTLLTNQQTMQDKYDKAELARQQAQIGAIDAQALGLPISGYLAKPEAYMTNIYPEQLKANESIDTNKANLIKDIMSNTTQATNTANTVQGNKDVANIYGRYNIQREQMGNETDKEIKGAELQAQAEIADKENKNNIILQQMRDKNQITQSEYEYAKAMNTQKSMDDRQQAEQVFKMLYTYPNQNVRTYVGALGGGMMTDQQAQQAFQLLGLDGNTPSVPLKSNVKQQQGSVRNKSFYSKYGPKK
jgi:hypothetical protein